eukprot:MONOS_16834.1-p1 / transcript=MONOS_16834.1 / gene=MONOS_16834 / organism=Monocercomonoides_exilis_PA203 / gene_product=unspecified product / transcript_product=unspecified product / location=Mono_scaffold00235:50771-52987(-) / protein_length=638 / sequence_SO=supercontig / SO=protein_coding / is_pseudo=false
MYWRKGDYFKARSWINGALMLSPSEGDLWALMYRLDSLFFPEQLEDTVARCTKARPTQGIMWQLVASQPKQAAMKTPELLSEVASVIPFEIGLPPPVQLARLRMQRVVPSLIETLVTEAVNVMRLGAEEEKGKGRRKGKGKGKSREKMGNGRMEYDRKGESAEEDDNDSDDEDSSDNTESGTLRNRMLNEHLEKEELEERGKKASPILKRVGQAVTEMTRNEIISIVTPSFYDSVYVLFGANVVPVTRAIIDLLFIITSHVLPFSTPSLSSSPLPLLQNSDLFRKLTETLKKELCAFQKKQQAEQDAFKEDSILSEKERNAQQASTDHKTELGEESLILLSLLYGKLSLDLSADEELVNGIVPVLLDVAGSTKKTEQSKEIVQYTNLSINALCVLKRIVANKTDFQSKKYVKSIAKLAISFVKKPKKQKPSSSLSSSASSDLPFPPPFIAQSLSVLQILIEALGRDYEQVVNVPILPLVEEICASTRIKQEVDIQLDKKRRRWRNELKERKTTEEAKLMQSKKSEEDSKQMMSEFGVLYSALRLLHCAIEVSLKGSADSDGHTSNEGSVNVQNTQKLPLLYILSSRVLLPLVLRLTRSNSQLLRYAALRIAEELAINACVSSVGNETESELFDNTRK